MTQPRIRTLIVDDSAFARKVLRDILAGAPDVEVVGIARDGLEALEKIAELHPDVVTLDLSMPLLDGAGVLKALPRGTGPRVVLVSTATADSDRAIDALQAGAVELVHKPTALATQQLYEVSSELLRAIRTAFAARPALPPVPPVQPPGPAAAAAKVDLVVIGTSTGGPQALTRLLGAIPERFPAPIAIALHIPPGYTEALARRLNEISALEVLEAADGVELVPGRAVVARSGVHLRVRSSGGVLSCQLDPSPMTAVHRPSVDVLFESAAAAAGSRVLAAVLTGMGEDGLLGSRALVAAGAKVVTEAESSCVVYGMPRAVKEAGLSTAEAPLPEMARLLSSLA